jgi:hypothetical protein
MQSLLNQKYQYPSLQRRTINGKRQYTDGGDPVPSVTTILDGTADKTHLIEWRNRVGHEEANRQSQQAANLGTIVHDSIEKFVLGEDYQVQGNNLSQLLARNMVDVLADQGLKKIDEVWGLECGLIAQSVYAGTADCVGVYDGQPAIIDYKTAKQIKPKEWITDYFLQGILYSVAHNEMFNTEIDTVVILMIDRNCQFKEYLITGDEYRQYENLAMKRLITFYNMSTT